MASLDWLTLAGVPALVRVPPAGAGAPPVVVCWHGFGLPNSERAMADALPLADVPAVVAHLGLPLFGARLPAGGLAEIARRQAADYVQQLFVPSIGGAVAELPAVLAALRAHVGRATGPVALVGFSASGLAPLLALAERAGGVTAGIPITAVVAINTVPQLTGLVALAERFTGPYAWSAAARAEAARFDLLARAPALAAPSAPGGRPPALLLLHGAADEYFGPDQLRALFDALAPRYAAAGAADRLAFVEVTGLTHHFGAPDPTFPVAVSDPALVRPHVEGWVRRWVANA